MSCLPKYLQCQHIRREQIRTPTPLYFAMTAMEGILLLLRKPLRNLTRRFFRRPNNKVSVALPTKAYYLTVFIRYL